MIADGNDEPVHIVIDDFGKATHVCNNGGDAMPLCVNHRQTHVLNCAELQVDPAFLVVRLWVG
jgi:hypothetical protein